MNVRCKMKLTQIVSTEYHPGYVQKRFVFEAQYDNSIEEDRRFAKASPTGRFEIQVDNPVAADAFTVGEYYYFDAIPVPKPVAEAA